MGCCRPISSHHQRAEEAKFPATSVVTAFTDCLRDRGAQYSAVAVHWSLRNAHLESALGGTVLHSSLIQYGTSVVHLCAWLAVSWTHSVHADIFGPFFSSILI